jgi:YebC/PmpR family DNA-binding regulatory protein
MAGHSKFKNIMHRKGAQDAKRAKQFAKLVRELIVAVKTGGEDPEFNPRLRTAIATAKAANLPKDRIVNAIKKASSGQEGDDFEEVRYECYAPGGIALIIDALTNNRNRASGEIKAALSKYHSTLAEPGSVIYMFDRVGMMEFHSDQISPDEIMEAAIESGAEECESDENIHEIYCDPDELNSVREFLANKFGDPVVTELTWKAKNKISINDVEKAEKLLKLIDILEDNEDVQSVSGNYEIPDEIAEKINI